MTGMHGCHGADVGGIHQHGLTVGRAHSHGCFLRKADQTVSVGETFARIGDDGDTRRMRLARHCEGHAFRKLYGRIVHRGDTYFNPRPRTVYHILKILLTNGIFITAYEIPMLRAATTTQ